MSNILVIVGKTCSGKNTVLNELINLGYESIVTYTSRPPRAEEVNAKTYHFITKDNFMRKIEEDFFAEYTSYNVANGDIWYYGTAKEDLKKADNNKVIILNPDGLKTIRQIENIKSTVILLDANKDTIIKRLKGRGDDLAESERRIKADELDFKGINKYVDFIINTSNLNPKEIAEIVNFTYNKINNNDMNSWLLN